VRVVLITENFPPQRTSGAVQLRDLSREFVRQGHQLTVLLPDAAIPTPWALEKMDGVQVLRLKALRTKDIGYVRRTLGELLTPFAMMHPMRNGTGLFGIRLLSFTRLWSVASSGGVGARRI